MAGPDNSFNYCECECGEWFQVLSASGTGWDEQATMTLAYEHYAVCDVAFERAPQLIVAMNETLIAKGFPVPSAATSRPAPGGKGGR